MFFLLRFIRTLGWLFYFTERKVIIARGVIGHIGFCKNALKLDNMDIVNEFRNFYAQFPLSSELFSLDEECAMLLNELK